MSSFFWRETHLLIAHAIKRFKSNVLSNLDFENAAFTVFVALVTRVVLAFDLALYIPLSKVQHTHDNACIASKR
jgi:hypothetical protein